MKLEVLQENLNKGLSIALRTIANRPQLPVLTHLLLKTDKGRLKVSSTDLEIGTNLLIGSKIEQEGMISVPGKIFAEFVASLPAEKVSLDYKENSLAVVCGPYKAKFNCLPAAEFPKMPETPPKPFLTLTGDLFSKSISQVVLAAATDETRPVLAGVYLFCQGEDLMLVATDGYRLSLKALKSFFKGESETSAASFLKKGLVIPARAFREAIKIADGEGKVKVYLVPDASQLVFGFDDVEIVTRLIEGKFPDFEKIIPSESKIQALVDVSQAKRIVKTAAIFARESANIVRFQLSQQGIKISANMAQVGESENFLEAKVEGGEEKIAFNARYLLDFLGIVDQETFVLKVNNATSPGVFSSEGDDSFIHIIMPVRVQDEENG
ncbi:DNA polymerase III subunit beta [Patescibacteria group bacterium]